MLTISINKFMLFSAKVIFSDKITEHLFSVVGITIIIKTYDRASDRMRWCRSA